MSENAMKTNAFGSFPALRGIHFGVHFGGQNGSRFFVKAPPEMINMEMVPSEAYKVKWFPHFRFGHIWPGLRPSVPEFRSWTEKFRPSQNSVRPWIGIPFMDGKIPSVDGRIPPACIPDGMFPSVDGRNLSVDGSCWSELRP